MNKVAEGRDILQPANIVNSLNSKQPMTEPFSLKNGQIVYGKINKIFQNGTAEVQIGSQKLLAKLDAPLQSGERYWLQVHAGSEGISLKALQTSNPLVSMNRKDAASQLLFHLSLPNTKEANQLAQYFLKHSIPITAENFSKALEWIKNTPDFQSSANIIRMMAASNLPFSNEVFRSLHSFEKGAPLHVLLGELQRFLQDMNSDTSNRLKLLLQTILSNEGTKLAQHTMHKLLQLWITQDQGKEAESSAAFKLLQGAGFISTDENEHQVIARFLDTVKQGEATKWLSKDLIPLKEGLQVMAELSSALKGNRMSELQLGITKLQEWSSQLLLSQNKGNLSLPTYQEIQRNVQIVLASLQYTENERSNQVNNKIMHAVTQITKSMVSLALADVGNEQLQQVQFNDFVKAVTGKSERELLGLKDALGKVLLEKKEIPNVIKSDSDQMGLLNRLTNAGNSSFDLTRGTAVASMLKEMIQSLGLGFEHYLNEHKGQDLELQTLKPLLLKLLNDIPPNSAKDVVEQVLHRITAQQILSQEAGPLQNLIVQIPLTLGGFRTDLNMQWSGRKKEDGTLDPHYCRVLFYLELEYLERTVIDLQIQNKVMKVTIINEKIEEIKQLAQTFLPLLKENLEKIGYQLSTVAFEKPDDNRSKGSSEKLRGIPETNSYSGVDIRI